MRSSPTKGTFFCTEVLKVNGFYQFVIKIKILPTTLNIIQRLYQLRNVPRSASYMWEVWFHCNLHPTPHFSIKRKSVEAKFITLSVLFQGYFGHQLAICRPSIFQDSKPTLFQKANFFSQSLKQNKQYYQLYFSP